MPLQARSLLFVHVWVSGLIALLPLILILAPKASLLLVAVIFVCLIGVGFATQADATRRRLVDLVKQSRLIWCVGAFIAYGALSTLWSVSPLPSARLLVFEFALPVFLLVMVFAVDEAILAAVDLQKSLYGFVLAAVLLIFETRTGMALRGALGLRQWQGSLAHAGVTLAFLAPVIALFLARKSRWIAVLFLAFIGVSIALIVNDSAKLALFAFLVGALVFSQRLVSFRLALFACLAIYILAQPLIWSSLGGDYLAKTLLGFKESSVHRLHIWETFARLSLLNPLHGYGIASGHVLFQFETVMASLPESLRQYVDVWHPHNNYLEVWLDLGLFGIVLFLLALWQIFKGTWLTHRGPFASALAIAAVAACSHGLWQGWWIALICLIAMLYRMIEAQNQMQG